MMKCNGTGGTVLIFRKSSPSHLIFLGFSCKYTQHSWDEGLLEIQMACGVYSVQDSIPKTQRLEMNTSLGETFTISCPDGIQLFSCKKISYYLAIINTDK
ncbi:hypothetical protein [Parabacteroides faecis]|uniref:hypothetical protein n=1 Tax=Parabacteroides faecis TaxID=1217282 RepID=UPI0021661D0D|nr:hypothetical protein [Parabacteroides faecis]MCS2890048.1 hypothetical protein [Parabacteroides faecis]